MFLIKEKGIILNGVPWCPWLTQTLTPAMLNNLTAELNKAWDESKKIGKLVGISAGERHMVIAMDNLTDDVERDND